MKHRRYETKHYTFVHSDASMYYWIGKWIEITFYRYMMALNFITNAQEKWTLYRSPRGGAIS